MPAIQHAIASIRHPQANQLLMRAAYCVDMCSRYRGLDLSVKLDRLKQNAVWHQYAPTYKLSDVAKHSLAATMLLAVHVPQGGSANQLNFAVCTVMRALADTLSAPTSLPYEQVRARSCVHMAVTAASVTHSKPESHQGMMRDLQTQYLQSAQYTHIYRPNEQEYLLHTLLGITQQYLVWVDSGKIKDLVTLAGAVDLYERRRMECDAQGEVDQIARARARVSADLTKAAAH
jgi:hypothetical protein